MTTSAQATNRPAYLPSSSAAIFAILGLIDMGLLGVVGSSIAPRRGVSIELATLGLVTLVALVPARRGSRPGLVTAVIARIVFAILACGVFVAGGPVQVTAVEGFVIVATIVALILLPTAARTVTMGRNRFIVIGAVVGVAWAASLRGFMAQLAGLESTFTTVGTFGVILPTGAAVGALLGWAEYQHRSRLQYRSLILAPLLIGIIPTLATVTLDPGPVGLALLAMAGGYAISGRGPLWTRAVAGIVNLGGVVVTFLAAKLFPELSYTTPHGLWFDTLGASLGMVLALACAIPMRRPETIGPPVAGRRGGHRRPGIHRGRRLTATPTAAVPTTRTLHHTVFDDSASPPPVGNVLTRLATLGRSIVRMQLRPAVRSKVIRWRRCVARSADAEAGRDRRDRAGHHRGRTRTRPRSLRVRPSVLAVSRLR